MARILHLDPLGGAAGDMFLGLFADLGLPEETLASLPRRLGLDGVEVGVERARRGALDAARVRVHVRGVEEPPAEENHAAHEEAEATGHAHGRGHGHGGRTWADVKGIVEAADLPDRAKETALRAFELLFRAEAKVHGRAFEEVHLHEAGADDALIDICGAALALAELDVARVTCAAPLPLGGGTIVCAHGVLPAPGPAVVELLAGAPVAFGPIDRELITPTGAAILRAIVAEFGPGPAMTLERAGHGAGGRDDARLANVLRGVLGRADGAASAREVAVLETALDDVLPQDVPVIVERLLAAGARDAFVAPVQMKKGRPGFLLTVVADPEREAEFAALLLAESPTLGVRARRERRHEYDRDTVSVETPWGAVRIKRALDAARRPRRGQPEFEDCRRAADAAGKTVDEVRQAARESYSRRGDGADKDRE